MTFVWIFLGWTAFLLISGGLGMLSYRPEGTARIASQGLGIAQEAPAAREMLLEVARKMIVAEQERAERGEPADIASAKRLALWIATADF